jgi:2,5-diketo-D-gluconate reductase A
MQRAEPEPRLGKTYTRSYMTPKPLYHPGVSEVQVPAVALQSGVSIPQLGFGTWALTDPAEETATAIEVGYRLIDAAFAYKNEEAVGRGIRMSGVPRDELFVTSKLNGDSHGLQEAQDAFDRTARSLGLDYLDLYLIHWPNPWQDRYVEAWQGLEKLLSDGKVRSIGLSNFKPAHIDRILAEATIPPDLNQIELNPLVTRDSVREYHARKGIATESWAPLGQGGDLLSLAPIVEVANAHGKTPAQAVLRWHMDLGLITIPKSSNRERLAENLEIFDFSLTSSEVDAISALDGGEDAAVDSDVIGH